MPWIRLKETTSSPLIATYSYVGSPSLAYRQVILGWIVESDGTRWLTNDEIARGVIDTLDADASFRSIGQIEPLESNPEHARSA